MSDNVFPFRRMTRALLVPVAAQATTSEVPDNFIREDFNAFLIVNPNVCWIGLRGTSRQADGTKAPQSSMAMANADGADWLFGPGHVGVYSTQYPSWMSAIALAMPGFPLPADNALVPLRLYYGYGA